MESIKIDVNSWHYKLIRTMNGYVDAYDICEYRSKLVKALFASALVICMLILLGIAASFIVINTVLGIFTVFTLGFANLGINHIGSFAILFFIGIIAFYEHLKKKSRSYTKERKPGAIKKMYISWKEKHCSPVEFFEDDQNG